MMRFLSMSTFRPPSQMPVTGSFSSPIEAWKIRPINGFEKYLFTSSRTPANESISHIDLSRRHLVRSRKMITKIDPARSIYPRDAMGAMLRNTTTTNYPTYQLPKYDLVKTRSPSWTIKNVHRPKEIYHNVGPMTYDRINDKSQLACKLGWTQVGRRPAHVRLGLTIPFYDTRKYRQVGDPCSKHALILGRPAVYNPVKSKRRQRIETNVEYTHNTINKTELSLISARSIDNYSAQLNLFDERFVQPPMSSSIVVDDHISDAKESQIVVQIGSARNSTVFVTPNEQKSEILPSQAFKLHDEGMPIIEKSSSV